MEKKYKCNYNDFKSTRKETIQEMKDRLKREKMLDSFQFLDIQDNYENAHASIDVVRLETGIVYDDEMALHKCEWDDKYPEKPDRYFAVLRRCRELGLIDRCKFIPYIKADEKDIKLMHTEFVYQNLETVSAMNDIKAMETEAANFDSTYFNEATFNAARISTGCVMALVKAVVKGDVHNGMAIVRPPGHHAMKNDYCGYCFFNNVAIAAQHILATKQSKRILIVDFDVHHGQATQQMFYEDNRVLYFSIHRYEHGTFWPNLRESNFDYIGSGPGRGYNVNVPLNDTHLGDDDYLNIVFHILLPLAYEYNPDIIIFSAGYDSALGDEKGEMIVTPGFYGHLITLLGGLAAGKLAVCLEGGYYLPSLAEGAAMTLRALLDDQPAKLSPVYIPAQSVIEIINNVKFMLAPYWKCFGVFPLHSSTDNIDLHSINIKYLGTPDIPPYKTTGFYPVLKPKQVEQFDLIMSQLREDYMALKQGAVCYSYDDEMLEHDVGNDHPENPERLRKVYEIFLKMKLHERCVFIQSEPASAESLKLVHEDAYVDSVINATYKPVHSDMYFNANSPRSILRATGCLLSVVDSVMRGESKSGVALIRPPGHHAEYAEANGFCFINNVAVAAKHILKNYPVEKIMILDFDIHHGNGTQHIFYNDRNVLYLSVHKYNEGKYFPVSTDGNMDHVGAGAGLGYNVNIPFNKDKMCDTDYISVFHRVILPIAYAYSPDVVIVSAGFDAGVNDLLGTYIVSPEAFGHFVQMLKPLAQGRLILSLEGGYNINTLAYSFNLCIKALLGDPIPRLGKMLKPRQGAIDAVASVINIHKQYWKLLNVDKKLPDKINSYVHINADGAEVTVSGPSMDTLSSTVENEV